MPAGGGLATEESMTTIFPARAFFVGRCVVVDGMRPGVPPEVGNGGGGAFFGSGVLSAIILSAGVDAENRDREASRFGRRQQAARRRNPVHGLGQGQTHQRRHGTPTSG